MSMTPTRQTICLFWPRITLPEEKGDRLTHTDEADTALRKKERQMSDTLAVILVAFVGGIGWQLNTIANILREINAKIK